MLTASELLQYSNIGHVFMLLFLLVEHLISCMLVMQDRYGRQAGSFMDVAILKEGPSHI